MASFDSLHTGVKLLMLIEQQLAGNKVNPEVFRNLVIANTSGKGFDWSCSNEGWDIWHDRIECTQYDLGLCLCNIRSIDNEIAAIYLPKYCAKTHTLPKSALESIGITKFVKDNNIRPLIYYEKMKENESICSTLKVTCNIIDVVDKDLDELLLDQFYKYCLDLECSTGYKENIKNKFNELFKNGKDQNQLQGKEVYREYRESGSGIRLQSNKLRLTGSNLEYRSRYQRTGTKLGYRGVCLSFESRHLC